MLQNANTQRKGPNHLLVADRLMIVAAQLFRLVIKLDMHAVSFTSAGQRRPPWDFRVLILTDCCKRLLGSTSRTAANFSTISIVAP